MVNYIFKLEFNYKNTIFFSIQKQEKMLHLLYMKIAGEKVSCLKISPFCIHSIIHQKINGMMSVI